METRDAEKDKETHRYCEFISQSDKGRSRLNSDDIRNVILHLADFHYILEEFNTLFRI